MAGTAEGQKGYGTWVAHAREVAGEKGLEWAVGGQFEAFGIIEREMLRFYGLPSDGYLVDVGCGAGRLTVPLSHTHLGRYLGTDVVPDLVAHTRAKVPRADWRIEQVNGFTIPEGDGCVDMVCMFSVVTHLLHEQSYIYLRECKRVLRPGGRVVLSFLEFAMPYHWQVFQATVDCELSGSPSPLNVFIERNALATWAQVLGLRVVEFRDGADAFTPLPHPVRLDDGQVLEGHAALGQSICVLEKTG